LVATQQELFESRALLEAMQGLHFNHGFCRVRVSSMDSAVLGLAALGCGCCTVRSVFALEDAIEFHAFAPPLEALPCA
jgi:hypothetical protein